MSLLFSFIYSMFFFFTVKTLRSRLIIIHVLVCNTNVRRRRGVVCVKDGWVVEEGVSLDCCSSWLAAGLVSMATWEKKKRSTGSVPQSHIDAVQKNNVL